MSRYEDNTNRCTIRYYLGELRTAMNLEVRRPTISGSPFPRTEFGPLPQMEIRLKAAIVTARVFRGPEGDLCTRPVCIEEPISDESKFDLWADCPESPGDILCIGDIVEWLLFGTDDQMTQQYILVVRQCSGLQESFYKRVGTQDYELSTSSEVQARDYFIGAEVKWITLI
jgi:hypothetical protein